MAYAQYIRRGLTALSLLAPLASFAQPATFNSGFYTGLKLGGQHTMVSQDHSASLGVNNIDGDTASFVTAPDMDAQLFANNVLGNLNVGYAKVYEKYFLAAELSVNLAAEQTLDWEIAQKTVTSNIDNGIFETVEQDIQSEVTLENPDLIIDLRPGILLTRNFLLYGRIGVAFNQLSIEQEGMAIYTSENVSSFYPVGFLVSSSETKDVAGLRAGLGIERKFTPNLALNIDYVFTDYGDIDTTFDTSEAILSEGGDIVTAPNFNTSADVTKSIVTVGFNWYFDGNKPKPVMADK